jgi:hypothetical protein
MVQGIDAGQDTDNSSASWSAFTLNMRICFYITVCCFAAATVVDGDLALYDYFRLADSSEVS